jgi:type I restriction enzyme S subunit
VIPHGWREATVEEICETVSVGIVIRPTQYYTTADKGIKAFRSMNIKESKVNDDDWAYITVEGHKKNAKSRLRAGDVLVVRSGAPGTCCVVTEEFDDTNCIDIVFARPKRGEVTSHYLCAFTNSSLGRRQIESSQGGLALKHFNVAAYKDMLIQLPPIEEQEKITSILTIWNDAIGQTQRLMDARTMRKRALSQNLLFGKARLQGHKTKWKEAPLSEVTKELRERNNSQFGSEAVMAVNKFQGLIPMREHVMASSLERYKVVPPKAFAYNPMRINIGSLAISHHSSNVLVSPDYVVFKCIEDRCDPDFLDHYRRTHAWEQYVNAVGNGSVRVRIYYSELSRMKLRLPPIEEQKAISAVLNDADREIDLTKLKLAALQKQKRGLMQKLLTGEWRIKVAREDKE